MVDRLIANWPLKLLALAVAFVIWAAVTAEGNIVQDFEVVLDIQMDQKALIRTSDPPNTVTVRLRGPESLIRRLDPLPLKLTVALDTTTAGTHELQLSEDVLSGVPRGVEVVFIEPSRLSLTVDERYWQTIEIEPTFEGVLPEGYEVYRVDREPDSLLVEGPRTQVLDLQSLETSPPIQLDGRIASFIEQRGVVPNPHSPRVRVVDPRPVRVTVSVDSARIVRTFENVEIQLLNTVHEATVRPDKVDVTLAGPSRLIEGFSAGRIEATVDLTGVEPIGVPQPMDVRLNLRMPVRDRRWIEATLSRPRVDVRVSERRRSS